MAVCDDPIKSNFVKVGRLQLQHLVDAFTVDLVSRRTYFLGRSIGPPKAGVNQLLTVLVQQVEGIEMRAGRNLDKFSETVTNLSDGQSAQEGEIKEGMHRCMVCTQTVFVVAIVDSYLDRHRRVNQTNDSRWDPDIIGVPTIGSTSEPAGLKRC